MIATTNSPSLTSIGGKMSRIPGLDFNHLAMEGSDIKIMDAITKYCNAHPDATKDICLTGLYGYILNIRANVAFTALFVIVLVAYIIAFLTKRRAKGFSLAMVLGCICEVLGYAGRTWSQQKQFDIEPFLLQICCLTIGPAFMAAGIYLCLGWIVRCFGSNYSRIPPSWYTRFFIPCDIVSLILQGAGGGLAAHTFKTGGKLKHENTVMIAGLSFQLFTMFLFVLAALDFAIRVFRRYRAHGDQALDRTESIVAIRKSKYFRPFLYALGIATICISVRCVFRVFELSGGWTGPHTHNQSLFIVFEGLMIFGASAALAIFNPCLCLKELPADTDPTRPGHILNVIPESGKPTSSSIPASDV